MSEHHEMLRGFLAAQTATPFKWGESDCALFCASWIARVTGVDPAADLRGSYATEQECAALLAREGGLLAIADRLRQAARLRSVAIASPGDIAVVETRIGPAMMIFAGRAWAWKSPRGVLFARPAPHVIWGI